MAHPTTADRDISFDDLPHLGRNGGVELRLTPLCRFAKSMLADLPRGHAARIAAAAMARDNDERLASITLLAAQLVSAIPAN